MSPVDPSTSVFSAPVPPDAGNGVRPADPDLLAGLRRSLAGWTVVEVGAGSRHDRYPRPVDEPLVVVGDAALVARLAAALTEGSSDDGPSTARTDLRLWFSDGTDDAGRMLHVAGRRVTDPASASTWSVDLRPLAEALTAAGVPDGFLPRAPQARGPVTPTAAGVALTTLWLDRLPGSRPVGHELRTTLAPRWVRFHSLPGGRRLPADESDHREVVRRQRSLLAALADLTGVTAALLVTTSWSSGDVAERPTYLEELTPRSWFWDSIVVEVDDRIPSCLHLWVESVELDDPRVGTVLRMAADEATTDLILADPGLRWLFAPYDGGVDVIAPSVADRDRLAARFARWRPADGGL